MNEGERISTQPSDDARGASPAIAGQESLGEALVGPSVWSSAGDVDAARTLVGGLAHSFNNLFQALLSRAELLRGMRWPERSAGQVVDALAADVQRGAEVIGKLVLIAQGCARVREQIDLNEIVLEDRIPFADPWPRVVTMLASGPCWVHGDREALVQAVGGLVANAVDYSPPSGQVILRTCCDNGAVYLEVTDRGPGVPKGIRGRICEPFFTTRRAEGHDGLGLSVASAVVAAHGGRLELEISPARGTTFRVMLPALSASGGSNGRDGTRKVR